MLVYRKSTHTDQYLQYSSHHQISLRKVLFRYCLIWHIPVPPIKDNGYRESIISKIFKRIANNHSLSQSQQQMQATDIEKV